MRRATLRMTLKSSTTRHVLILVSISSLLQKCLHLQRFSLVPVKASAINRPSEHAFNRFDCGAVGRSPALSRHRQKRESYASDLAFFARRLFGIAIRTFVTVINSVWGFTATLISVSVLIRMRRCCRRFDVSIRPPQRKTAGFPRRFDVVCVRPVQRSSLSTLCCDWLASASAETAIDWRVDSAWLLAASSLVSARVRSRRRSAAR